MNSIHKADFALHVQLLGEALQTQNKTMIDECDRLYSTLMSHHYFVEALTTASQQVAQTNPEAYQWAVKHLPYLEARS
jgi:hypothetical protein